MEYIAEKKELLNALTAIAPAVPRKTNLSLLKNILFSGGTVTGNNLELLINARYADAGPEMLVPAKVIDIIKSLSGHEIKFIIDEDGAGTVVITDGTSKFKISCITDTEEYPGMSNTITGDNAIHINSESLRGIITHTLPFCSHESEPARRAFSGVLFTVEKEMIKCCSTDTYRLSMYAFTPDNPPPDKSVGLRIIIPAGSLREVSKMQGDIHMFLTGRNAIFIAGRVTILSRLIDEKFPDFLRIIPEKQEFMYGMCASDITSALSRAALVSESCKMSFSEDEVIISAKGHEGSMVEAVPASGTVGGGNIEIVFNPVFIQEGFKTMGIENVHTYISFTNDSSPVTMNYTRKGYRWLYLTLPIKPVN